MFRTVVFHDIPISDIASMERWYYSIHGPELVRRYGPWMQRFECFMPVNGFSVEREAFGLYNWRVTDGWWREAPPAGPEGTMALTSPPVFLTHHASCLIPPFPTEDFMGMDYQPHEKSVLRWRILFKYPDGVAKDEGEEWFLRTHVPETMKQSGLFRYFSYKAINDPIHLPGHWAPDGALPAGIAVRGWDRMVEMWYENFDDWHHSVIEAPPRYTAPSWATYDKYPFFKPYSDFVSAFLLERPVDEFLRDARVYL